MSNWVELTQVCIDIISNKPVENEESIICVNLDHGVQLTNQKLEGTELSLNLGGTTSVIYVKESYEEVKLLFNKQKSTDE